MASTNSDEVSDYDDGVHHCVLATGCEPESVWSVGSCILTKNRSSTSPLIFESILYLKYNRDLWDLSKIIEANLRRKSHTEAKQKKFKEHRNRFIQMRNRLQDWDAFRKVVSDIESQIVDLDDESTIGKTMEESDEEEGSESDSESDDED